MKDYPELDELERTAFTETIMLLDTEAGLDSIFQTGIPYATSCRWCSGKETYRLKIQMRHPSKKTVAYICECDRTASDLYLPREAEEGWLGWLIRILKKFVLIVKNQHQE